MEQQESQRRMERHHSGEIDLDNIRQLQDDSKREFIDATVALMAIDSTDSDVGEALAFIDDDIIEEAPQALLLAIQKKLEATQTPGV